MDIKKLLIRAGSGLIYVAIIVGCTLWGMNGIYLLGILFAGLATIEFEKLCGNLSLRDLPLVLLDLAGVYALLFAFNPTAPIITLCAWVAIMIVRMISELYTKRENPLRSLSISALIQLYIGLPFSLMVATATISIPKIILLLFIFLWINDTGAYIVGSLIGKHKLFVRVSPKKSWEGFFGGLIFNIGAAFLFCYGITSYFGFHSNIWIWIGWTLIVTIFGTWGDLIESLIKRFLNVKDSGNLIPGHGGILDRIDSFLLAMPAAFLYVVYLLII
ncbi:MAG: phosphatidate cytidylyltransferase [Muribaculaceae bacterium]|nr:phosphatidate cytidylyltransferase [Muribaculaceae bacterium]